MKKIAFSVALVLCAASCGGSIEPLDQGEDDAAAASYLLFTVRRDLRKCAAPACGGWWVSAVHQDASPLYVSGLDFSRTKLDAAAQDAVRAAPGEELLFKARIGAADKRGQRMLLVKDAWRGMPGVAAGGQDVVYSVAARVPQKTCVAAPCNNQVATAMGSGKTTELTRVGVQRAAQAFVDQEWLQNRVVYHGALVAAHVASGQKMAAGAEVVLDASQVWLHLPENAGPCAQPREDACSGGQVQAWDRTPDRCIEPLGCVNRGVCSMMMMPSCPAGYVAITWSSAPNGCPATACDPAWVVQ